MINSKQKGKRGEREWVLFLRSRGEVARRGQQFSGSLDSPDVVCESLPMIHFEVKFAKKVDIVKAMEQACNDAPTGKIRVVAWKQTGPKKTPWMTTMMASEFSEFFSGTEALPEHLMLKFFNSLKASSPLVTCEGDDWHKLVLKAKTLWK